MTRLHRAWRLALVAVVATLALAGVSAVPAHAGGSRAVVIVDTGSGTYTRVISFDGTISGYDALVLAGANPTTYGFAGQGVAVCQLFGVGHAADDSCLGTPDDPSYWAYYRSPSGSGGWQYSRGGAGATSVSDGDVEGWRFGAGGAPGYQSFCAVAGCAPPPTAAPAPGPAPGAATVGGGPTSPAGLQTNDPASGPAATAAAVPRTDAAGGPADTGSGAGTDATTPPTTGRVAAAAESSRADDRDQRALGRPTVAIDGGSGSPAGVLVAVGLVALIGGAAVVVRRRRTRRPSD